MTGPEKWLPAVKPCAKTVSLPVRDRREGGFVDETGHGRPAVGQHLDVLADSAQVHQESLPAQLGRSQTLHNAPGEPRQYDAHRNRLANNQVGNGQARS